MEESKINKGQNFSDFLNVEQLNESKQNQHSPAAANSKGMYPQDVFDWINPKIISDWINKNLVMQDEARAITKQSISAFNQSVSTGRIKPFVEFGQSRKTRLYNRADLEAYALNKRGYDHEK